MNMQILVLSRHAKIIQGFDFGKEGMLIRLIEENNKILAVIKFNSKEYGIYNLSDIEILCY